MLEEKHASTLPTRAIRAFAKNCRLLMDHDCAPFNTLETMALKLCTSYEQDQETIKALAEALRNLITQFIDYTPQFKRDEYHKKCWELIEAEAALALAKKKG